MGSGGRVGRRGGGWRAAAWVGACVLALGLSGLAASAVKSLPESNALVVLIALAGAFLFWWWTPHLLLGGRIGWRALLPSAARNRGALAAPPWVSPPLPSRLVARSAYEFRPRRTVLPGTARATT